MATLRIWAEIYESADATNTRIHHPILISKACFLSAVRFYWLTRDNCTYTSISGKLYSDDGAGAPQGLIASSTDSRSKANLATLANEVSDTYLTFNKVPLVANAKYHFVVNISGYSPSATAFCGLLRAWPDPIVTPSNHSHKTLLSNGYQVYPIFGVL